MARRGKDPIVQSYYSQVTRHIEEEETKAFPREEEQPLYGRVVIQFALVASGKVENIEVQHSNSQKCSITRLTCFDA